MMTLVAGLEHAPLRMPGFLVFESLSSLRAPAADEPAAPSARSRRARLDTLPPESPRAIAGGGVATRLNGAECWIRTRFANRKLWAEVKRSAQLLLRAGGVEVHTYSAPLTVAEVWLPRCTDPDRVQRRVRALAGDLLEIGREALPDSCAQPECLPAFELHQRGSTNFEARLHVTGTDPILSARVATMARAIAVHLARLAETPVLPEVQLGVLEVECVRARCSINLRPAAHASGQPPAGTGTEAASTVVIDELLRNAGLQRRRPALAALHNAHVLAAFAAAAAAAGVEAAGFTSAARRHAARWGSCEPLVTWRRQGDTLKGELDLPVDLESIYAGLRRQDSEATEAELRRRARDLAAQVASIGLAASLAHLRVVLIAASARGRGPLHAPRLVSSTWGRSSPGGDGQGRRAAGVWLPLAGTASS